MCTQSELNRITTSVAREYQLIFGDALKEVVLCGSYARGDYDSESDVDIVGIVDRPRTELSETYRKLAELASDLSLEYGLTVSPAVIPFADYEKYKDALPYYRNIGREGVRIYA